MKKKIVIVISAMLLLFTLCVAGLLVFYNTSLEAVNKEENTAVMFVVENGSSSKSVIDALYSSNLIKNKYVGYVYFKLNSDVVLQAGVYDLSRSMDFKEIIDIISNGKVVDNSISVTFIEGKRITNYVKVISENFGYSEEDILNVISNKEYLEKLIDRYWFLTDEILDDRLYYALEGYLSPNTYYFDKNASVEVIIEKMLDTTAVQLSKYKDSIDNSEYTVHEMITMASIVELEGSNSDDRYGVAGVFYNRLENGWSLGSDVTTYYAEQIEMSDRDLWQHEIDEVNDYNTRPAAMAGKLPVGPISNPGSLSIAAALEPEQHDYFYFVADKYKKTYFSKTYSEHASIISKLKNDGLWYTYE